MSTEITRRQVIMLVVLGVVLVLVLYVQLLIRPALSTVSETKEQIESLQQQYETLLQQSQSYDQNVQSLEGWKEANAKETKRLYPLGDAWQIDRFLNFVIKECGITIDGLVISDAQEYFIDGESNLILSDPDLLEESAETVAETDSEDASVGYTATGEYRQDFTYSMKGNYNNMVQLLNFVDSLSFLGISSYTFDTIDPEITEEDGEEITGMQDLYSFTVTINAYMYSDPLTEEESEADETESADADVTADETAAENS